MPRISNLQLTIERNSNDHNQVSPRSVTVSFTTNFSATEMFAHVVYKADVSIKSQRDSVIDPDQPSINPIGSRIITSSTNQVQTTMAISMQRQFLDEDPDHIRVNGIFHDVAPNLRDDEFIAEVKLTPVIFATVTAQSPLVVGSWGMAGQD